MYSGTVIVFCLELVLVRCYPALYFDYYASNPDAADPKVIEIDTNADYTDPLIFSQSSYFQNQNGDGEYFFNKKSIVEDLDYSPVSPLDEPIEYEVLQSFGEDRNTVYDKNLRNLKEPVFLEVLPRRSRNYNVYQHDGAPKRFTTYIHGLVQSREPTVFNGHTCEQENRLPFNRPPRKTQSYEEFLAQLSHDAMMNNILPTMSYLRTPNAQYAYPSAYTSGSAVASFPRAGNRGCAQPILFGCSPVVSQGYLAHQSYPQIEPQIQILTPYKGYAEVPSRKIVREKVKARADTNILTQQ